MENQRTMWSDSQTWETQTSFPRRCSNGDLAVQMLLITGGSDVATTEQQPVTWRCTGNLNPIVLCSILVVTQWNLLWWHRGLAERSQRWRRRSSEEELMSLIQMRMLIKKSSSLSFFCSFQVYSAPFVLVSYLYVLFFFKKSSLRICIPFKLFQVAKVQVEYLIKMMFECFVSFLKNLLFEICDLNSIFPPSLCGMTSLWIERMYSNWEIEAAFT